MQALAWWDWDHAALRAALDDFRNLSAEAFLERYEGRSGGAIPVNGHTADTNGTSDRHREAVTG